MEPLYALKLWNPATPAFCSASRLYIGSRGKILQVAKEMEEYDKESETAMAIRDYFAGNSDARHSTAYQEIPVLEQVQLLSQSEMELPKKTWKHLNAWNFEYKLKL